MNRSRLSLLALLALTLASDTLADELPSGAVARLGSLRLRHGGSTIGLAYSPDGKTIATGGWDMRLRLWDVASAREVRQFVGHTDAVWGVRFLADGKRLLSSGRDGTLRLWEIETGRELKVFKGHTGPIYKFVLSPDERTLYSGSYDKTVWAWDMATAEQKRQIAALPGQVQALALTGDGAKLAGGTDGGVVILWDAGTGAELQRFQAHPGGMDSLAFTPDDRVLASGGWDNTVGLWNTTDGREVGRLKGHEGSVWPVVFTRDGKRLLSAGKDQTIRIWDWAAGKELRKFTGHEGGVPMVALSPDEKKLASVGHDYTVRLWDVPTGKELFPHTGHHSGIAAVAVSSDGKQIATGGKDKTVRVWDSATGKQTRVLEGHTEILETVAFSPDNHLLASGGRDGGPRLWEASTGRLLRTLPGDAGNWTRAIAFSSTGEIATAGNGTLLGVWSLSEGRRLRTVPTGQAAHAAEFVSGGTLATALSDRSIVFWDGQTPQKRQMTLPADASLRVAFAPGGRTIATVNPEGKVLVCETVSGKERFVLTEDRTGAIPRPSNTNMTTTPGIALAFSPDGRLLATSCLHFVIRIRDTLTGRLLATLRGHEGMINGLAFAANGSVLVSASNDNTVLVWDVRGLRKTLDDRPTDRTPEEQDALWTEAAHDNPLKAWPALVALAQSRDGPATLRGLLDKVSGEGQARRIDQFLADLDSDEFAIREKATEDLEKLGRLAEYAVRRALQKDPPVDMRRRLERVIDAIDHAPPSLEVQRLLRAVEVLEVVDTAETRRVLDALARGSSIVAAEAKAALGR